MNSGMSSTDARVPEIPEGFRSRIVRIFGDEGSRWLASLPHTLQELSARWGLSNLRSVEGLSVNFVCYADSAERGPVVLKVGSPNPERLSEIRALSLYGGRGACRVYESDLVVGAMVLERAAPGHDLWTVDDRSERIRVAASTAELILVPVQSAEAVGLPTYASWVSKAFGRARAEGLVPKLLLALVQEAEAEFIRLVAECSPERASMLLHGDLHHANILWSQGDGEDDGTWKVIDPHGVIGLVCTGPARFIENELGDPDEIGVEACKDYACMDEMVVAFSATLGEVPRRIAAAVFVDKVLSTCWHYEDNAPPEKAERHVELCAFHQDYLNARWA